MLYVRNLMVVAVVVCVAGSALAAGIDTLVSDPTKINVLRQYGGTATADVTGNELWIGGDDVMYQRPLNAVTQSVYNIGRVAAGDGGGWNDEADIRPRDWDEDTETWLTWPTASHTWIFPGARVVQSWCVQMETSPGTFEVQYLRTPGTDDWVTWDTKQYTVNSSFTDYNQYDTSVTAYGIRYVASNGSASNPLRVSELQVFLAPDQTVTYGDGYNIFTQDIVAQHYTSRTDGAWVGPNGGSAEGMRDGVANSPELKSQNGTGRSYVGYTFTESIPLSSFTLGGRKDQGWKGNWEVYTCNGGFIDLSEMEGCSAADLVEAGWTLQVSYSYGRDMGSTTLLADFLFAQAGFWDNLLVVWDVQGGAVTEFELHGSAARIPEPATMTLLALGGLALLRRRK